MKQTAQSKALHAKLGKKEKVNKRTNSRAYFGVEPSKEDVQREIEDKKYDKK